MRNKSNYRPTALSEAESISEQHLSQIDELEQTLHELRGSIGAGQHVPPGVHILSVKQNPAQEWEDLSRGVVERLKRENEAEVEGVGGEGNGDG